MAQTIIKILFLVFSYSFTLSNDGPLIKNIDLQNFEIEVLQPDLPVFFKISVPWCSSCKKLEPIFDEFALEFDCKAIFVSANVDSFVNQDLLQKIFHDYKIIIGGFPIILIFHQGKYIKLVYVRGEDKESLKKTLDIILNDIQKGLLQ